MAKLLKNASLIQKTLNTKKKQEAASTAASQSGSTNIPTTTSTPKVTQPKKTENVQSAKNIQESIQRTQPIQPIQTSDLFGTPSISTLSTVRQQTGATGTSNLLNTTTEEKDIEKTTIPTAMVRGALSVGGDVAKQVTKTLYNQGLDYAKNLLSKGKEEVSKTVQGVKELYGEPVKAFKESAVDMFKGVGQSMLTDIQQGEGPVGMIRDAAANTLEGLPRGIVWAEEGLVDLLDWGIDAKRVDNLKKEVERDREYWENTRVQKKVKEAESFKDVLKNPFMYAGGTLGEMAPMFISAWVAIPTTFAQVYGETYRDYATDASLQEAGLTDNQIRLMSLGVAGVNTIIELGSDLIEGIMPWTRAGVKGAEKNVRRTLTKPFMNIFKNVVKGGLSEGVEEVLQNEIQEQVASYYGSDRELPTWTDRLTTFGVSALIGGILQGGNIMIDLKQHKELEKAFEERAEAVDDIAPGVSKEDKEKLFSAIVAAETQDSQMSDRQVSKYQQQAEQLYNKKAELTEQLNTTTNKQEQQIINRQIEDIDAKINSIDERVNAGQRVMDEVNQKLQELSQPVTELPAQQQVQPSQIGGENLSSQTMKSVMAETPRITMPENKQEAQDAFRRAVQQVREGKSYTDTDFAKYAYTTSGRMIEGTQERRDTMINKVQDLLKNIGVTLQISDRLGEKEEGTYTREGKEGAVTYGEKASNMIVYGHEVFHAMKDIIENGTLTDKKLQRELAKEMRALVNLAKKYLYLDDIEHTTAESRMLANQYAEEWLSNAFGEYIANREIPDLGPKTFKERVIRFFNRLIDFIKSAFKGDDKKYIEDVFRNIAEGNVRGTFDRIPYVDTLRRSMVNPIEESMDETQMDLEAAKGEEYNKMVENTKQEQEKLDNGVNEIADNMEQVTTDVNDAQEQGEILDAIIPEIEEIAQQPIEKAIPSTIDAVERSVDKQIRSKEKKEAIKSVREGFKNVFTPALSRLYNISPRLAGAVHTYQATTELKSLGYKRLSTDFVKAMDKLRKKDKQAYRKLSLALFDYGMVDDIDIKDALREAGIDPKLFEPVANILNRIAQDYKDAGLDITINDKYFPRKVKDYGLLLDYMSRKAGKDIKDTRQDLLQFIEETNKDATLSEGEKEKRIHAKLINEFTKPSERSNNAKERKLVLSEWQLTEEEKAKGYKNDIIDFYEDPIKSLDAYITDMVKKTELKKMLGGLTAEGTAISEDFDESVAGILLEMEARGELTKEKADEAAHTIRSIINAKTTGKGISAIKNTTYSLTIANWFSAFQQLEDLSKTLLRGPSGFKNTIKSLIGKANIKMDDTGLENIFAVFEGGDITNALFKLSGFDMVDSLGKSSFLNTAYDSCVRQANGRKAIILETRLKQMYGEEMGTEIFNAYKNDQLKDENGNLNLSVMVDLLYQLGNTQPIYRSAMPTAYLNNPRARLFYCLMSFTVKQIDWFVQGTKDVYNNQLLLGRDKATAAAAATGRCIGATTLVSVITALVTSVIDWAKGDDDDAIWNKITEEGWLAGLKQLGIDSISGLFKIFNISRYDQYIFKREGIEGVLLSKITPAPIGIASDLFDIVVGKKELSDLGRYGPLFLKPLYYQFKSHDMLPDYKLWGGVETKSKTTKNSGGYHVGGGTSVKSSGGYHVK